MVYKWAEGSKVVSTLKAQIAGTHLEKLRKKHDQWLTPKIVVEDARAESSPLHPAFEWNNKIAAEKYRETQAAYLLRSIVIVTSEEGQEERTVRAFVNLIEDDERIYTSVVRAMQEPELRIQVLSQAKRDFEALHEKYRDLEEFAGVYDALEKVEV